jgi:hypothetical protein
MFKIMQVNYLVFNIIFNIIYNFYMKVLLIGYGTDVVNGVNVPFWLIKNSWGTGWGINGFAKILRTNANLCGVMSNVMYPTIK